ncbi:hypothetical protein B296_00011871 [Ensete ventricosum]|uniref:Neprosin PEP catalytic domain-containing protein n=1 Tax=Ensete ventricosum TaxID=4639 RepID=A0A427B070_ENSVE|nr:hypothetical protein B296_00011871 [Ensete ventricosum]
MAPATLQPEQSSTSGILRLRRTTGRPSDGDRAEGMTANLSDACMPFSAFVKVHHLQEYEKDVWWLIYGDNGAITVGYWPTSLFRGLNHTMKLAVFGGDVYSQS